MSCLILTGKQELLPKKEKVLISLKEAEIFSDDVMYLVEMCFLSKLHKLCLPLPPMTEDYSYCCFIEQTSKVWAWLLKEKEHQIHAGCHTDMVCKLQKS